MEDGKQKASAADPLALPGGGPGLTVDLGEHGKADIFYFGIVQVRRYSEEISLALMTLAKTGIDPKSPAKAQYMAAMLPYVMLNLLGLVAECVVIRNKDGKGIAIGNLPHWILPKVVEGWVELNLGEEQKWGPWLAVVEKTVETMTGKNIRISEMFSRPSSQPATPPESSSTADAPGGPTPDGASGN